MIILGIDPGSRLSGYGVLDADAHNIRLVEAGVITTDAQSSAAENLYELYSKVRELLTTHGPEILAVEKLFFFKNQKTVMGVAEARGVILLAGAERKLPIKEFTPLEVKTSVVGYGNADKKQVQKMVQLILKLPSELQPDDAADAVAIALCAAHHLPQNS